MKKVILIGSLPPPFHGSNVYFSNLLNSELRDKFEISHLDISDHRSLDNLSKLDFTNVFLALKNLFKLIPLIRKVKPVLIYIPVSSNFLPYFRDGLFILISHIFSDAKIIIHLHEGDYFRKYFYERSNSFVKFFIRYTLAKVDTAIVYSDRLKYNFEGFVKNIVAFPNGLEAKNNLSEEYFAKIPKQVSVISFYSNLFESKGVLDVLEAAAIVIKKNSNVRFLFTGNWIKKEEKTRIRAEQIINKNNLNKYVEFTGVITGEAKEKFLKETDIMVFPTWYPYEGCPMVILESMEYSIPVISTKDTGAIPEMISDGETGILVERNNPAEIAEAIFKLLAEENLRIIMGKKARERFKRDFTFDRNLDNIITAFTKALN